MIQKLIIQSNALRNALQFDEAIKILTDGELNGLSNPALLIELIRLSVLKKDKSFLKNYLNQFEQFPEYKRRMDEDIFLRLHLSFPDSFNRDKKIDILPKPYTWLNEFKQTKTDKIYDVEVSNCSVYIKNFTHYKITGICQSCNESHTQVLKGTIIVHKNYFCPVCLARQRLTFTEIRRIIRKKYPQFLMEFPKDFKEDYELKIRRLAKKLNQSSGNTSIPLLMRYLNQDIISVLNQLSLKSIVRRK